MTCNQYKYGWLLYHKKDIDKNRWFIDNFIEKFKIHCCRRPCNGIRTKSIDRCLNTHIGQGEHHALYAGR